MKQEEQPEGYNVANVESWVSNNIEGLTPPFKWTRLEGGHSNLTYQLDDSNGKQAVIRRPPQGVLLPKAHDMSREWALISALGPTPVPVPEAIGFCENPDVTGAWFYIMGMVNGRPLYNGDDSREWVAEENRGLLGESFIDVLADLHAQDPDSLGLGDLGKKDSYVARQLKTWYRSWNASIEGAKLDDPRAHEFQQYFLDHLPDQGSVKVVHGDYGCHNCLIGAGGRVAAVVDWEISTLGDPLADLTYALNQWAEAGDELAPGADPPTAMPGFHSRGELASRYAEKTGRDLSKLDYYIAFNRWKSAAIVHGVYARYMDGKKSADGADLDEMRTRIGMSLDRAEEAINRIR